MGGAVAIAHQARSPQIEAAARLMAISWGFSLQFWILFDGASRAFAFAGVDFCMAGAFFFMSRGRWFPVPLFFIHAALVLYHFYTMATGSNVFWINAFLNRAFEMALFYIIACAGYRIYALRRAAR